MTKEMYIDILRGLRDAARRKLPKNGESTVGFFFTTMLQNTGRF
jgi:hypothetical protein